MTGAISVAGLVKMFGSTRALDGLDLSVGQGEVHGLLGPNGAGKTTTIRILLGLMRSDGGTVKLLGEDPWINAPALHKRVAYVPGDVTLWPNLSGGEAIDLLGRMRGGIDQRRKAALLERFDLDPKKKGRASSKGNWQKVALIAALASGVELFVFDEPTSGLDPLMEETFRQVVREEQQRRSCSVRLSSHILSEVEALCNRVSIIRAGKTVDSGTLLEMRQLGYVFITAELSGPPSGLRELSGVHNLSVHDGHLECTVEPAGLNGLLRALTSVGVQNLTSRPPTLEELFLRHYDVHRQSVTERSGDPATGDKAGVTR